MTTPDVKPARPRPRREEPLALGRAMERAVVACANGLLTDAGRGGRCGARGGGGFPIPAVYCGALRLAFGTAARAAAAARGLAVGLGGGDLPRLLTDPAAEMPELAALAGGGIPITARDLGAAHEHLLELTPALDPSGRFVLQRKRGHARKATGSYYTPGPLVEHLLDEALEPTIREVLEGGGGVRSVRVCDPACGSGNFLIAAARRIAGRIPGVDPGAALAAAAGCVHGMDRNELAAELCHFCVWLECSSPGAPAMVPRENFVCGDALLAEWPERFPAVFERGGFDVVVGNPPFLNQLGAATATARAEAAALKKRYPGSARAYTDPAALFLVLAARITRPAGRVALVLPQSVLATRDAAPARAEVVRRCVPESLWVAGEHIFDAGVLVCAPTIRVGGVRRGVLRRTAGAAFRCLPDAAIDADSLMEAGTWAPLAAGAMGVPSLALRASGTLADHAAATADFRDQFYGLRGFIVEDEELGDADRAAYPKLITTGLVEPAECLWGRAATRFDGRWWRAPRVDLRRLEAAGRLGPWARSRLVPKVLLATQTRALEAVADGDGGWLPAVPLITIVPRDAGSMWRLAAALVSPPLTAWAAERYSLSGLSAGVIKLSARQALELPMPADGRAWDEAAAIICRASAADNALRPERLHSAGEQMCRAYGLGSAESEASLQWWKSLPRPLRRRGPTARSARRPLP